MRRIVDTFELDPVDSSYMEYLHFEWESHKELLSYILLIRDEYSLSYSKENYQHFMNSYQEARYKYNLSLSDLIKRICPQYYNSNNHEYQINFREETLEIIEIKED